MDEKTVKRVRRAASKIYKKPVILLSLPFNTKDEDNPPLDAVNLTFMCAPPLERFLRPYLLATEKVRHGYRVDTPAIITFEWADRPELKKEVVLRRKKGDLRIESSMPFSSVGYARTTVEDAPDGEDMLRVLVDGEDVRWFLLSHRRWIQDIRSEYPEYERSEVYKRGWLSIPKDCELHFAAELRKGVQDTTSVELRKMYKGYRKEYKGPLSRSELEREVALLETFGPRKSQRVD